MEQQGSPPCTPSTTRRATSSARDEPLSLSTPTVTVTPQHNTTSTTSTSNPTPTTPTAISTSPSTPPPRNPLSTSEPSLRFPRPQGNRHLANWISSSNPDIMRVTATEDTGLSESTYELISGTDTESQDGNYTESMSESVGSLDFHRPDDVHSIADTEQTFDDESVADGFEPHANLALDNQDDDHDTTILERSTLAHSSQLSALDRDADADSESEDDARSRSSLEYTQQSLKTPSIPTPEASKIVDRPAEVVDLTSTADEDEDIRENPRTPLRKWFTEWYADIREREVQAWNLLMQSGFSIPPGIILLIALLIPAFFSSAPYDLHNPAATSVLTTHSTTPPALSTSQASSTSWALSTTTGNAGLVPLENVQPDEWLFGGKKPELAVYKQQGHYLVRIPQDVKQAWLARKCLMFSATRGIDAVPIAVSRADDGMLIKFPNGESYGTVQVEITALCRPKLHQAFKITFEKGIMEEAFERTKHLAQDLTDLVPAAAQEAERCLGEARRSLESASDNVLTASDSLLKDLGGRFHNAHMSLGYIKKDIKERIANAQEELSKRVDVVKGQVVQRLLNAQDVQDQAQLGLLGAQISAKLWWLKITGSKDEHERYENKAKDFMAQKKVNAIEAYKTRHPNIDEKSAGPSRLWNKVFAAPRCGTKLGRGKRGIQQCNIAA